MRAKSSNSSTAAKQQQRAAARATRSVFATAAVTHQFSVTRPLLGHYIVQQAIDVVYAGYLLDR
jgi:hypothetical protein